MFDPTRFNCPIAHRTCWGPKCLLWDKNAKYQGQENVGCCTWQKIARDLSEIREDLSKYLEKTK